MMEVLIQHFHGQQWWMQTLIIADHVWFILCLIAIAYLLVFAVSGVINSRTQYNKAKKMYRYLILFVVNDGDEVVVESIKSFLKQDFPKTNYDLAVVSNKIKPAVRAELEQLPISVLVTDKVDDTKTQALQSAMIKFNDSDYDVVVVMDGDNVTDPDFLEKINNAYYSGGMAIQTHRVAKNRDTNTSILDAVSEEINNSIFRRGHVNIGFSSALIGSGMLFNYDWFKNNIHKATPIGLDKQLETMLLEQNIFIEYLDNVYVYGEKVADKSDFLNQRQQWSETKGKQLRRSLSRLPSALFHGNYDYCDKLFQWMLPSRTLLTSVVLATTIAISFISWPLSLKWWALLLILMLTFSLAIPDYLIDTRFAKALRTAPMLFILMIFKRTRKKTSKRVEN